MRLLLCVLLNRHDLKDRSSPEGRWDVNMGFSDGSGVTLEYCRRCGQMRGKA